MTLKKFKVPNFIIGGTYKAATTSVFSYVRNHPEVCASSHKEPGLFTFNYKPIFVEQSVSIDSLFINKNSNFKIFMEATAGYLELAHIVAKRIRMHIDEPKFLFILRDPIDRLLSYYNYYTFTRLEIPNTINFKNYIRYCKDNLEDSIADKNIPVGKKYLRALPAGKYSYYIREFLEHFDRNQIKILFYEDLKTDIRSFIKKICIFLNIDPSFFDDYNFQQKNITYSSRNKRIHQILLYIWPKYLERYLNPRPAIKDTILSFYKKINTKQINRKQLDPSLRFNLINYYLKSKEDLQDLLGPSVNIPWIW